MEGKNMATRDEIRALAKQDVEDYKNWKSSLKGMTSEQKKRVKADRKAKDAAERDAIKDMPDDQAKDAKLRRRMAFTRRHFVAGVATVAGLGILGYAGNYAWRNYSSTIKAFLGIDTQGVSLKNVDAGTLEEVQANAKTVIEELEAEGAVLLQNDDGVLPLKGTQVNVFGIRAYDSLYTGGGSSGVKRDDNVTLQAALTAAGVEYNPTLWNLYVNWYNDGTISTDDVAEMKAADTGSNEMDILMGGGSSVEELPADALTDDILADAAAYSNIAIIVIGRVGTEGADVAIADCYLNDAEKAMVDAVCSTFDDVIVLLNTGCYMDISWIANQKSIKGVLYVGLPGNTGYTSVAQILTGEVNPSGRTADTWAYDVCDQPSAIQTTTASWEVVGGNNVGGNSPEEDSGSGGFQYSNIDGQFFSYYFEGIYVGYRYYETRYGSDEIAYQEKVVWPFGYGLSYTDFEWDTVDFSSDDETINVTVKVTNTGDMAGKDVVEIYYNPPYYEDRGVEKSSANLIAFEKTPLIEPGESAEVTLSFKVDDMKSYDYATEKTYVLDEGDYEIKICKNAHEVVDTKTYTLDERRVLSTSERTGNKITNAFDDLTYDPGITYLSRADWEGTYPSLNGIDYVANDTILSKYEATIDDYTPEETVTDDTVFGVDSGLMLSDMTGVDYGDAKWDTFVEQLTEDEAFTLVGKGQYHTQAIERLGIPYTAAADGPVGLTSLYSGDSGMNYCSSEVIAGTWNKELAAKMGDAIGREGTAYGITCWYGPGFDTHRSVVGGRNYEYCSEDGYLAGAIGIEVVKAAQAQGLTCVSKHFAVNDQDNNRDNGIMTYANEQAVREIFLKPFEMVMTEGGSKGVMVAMMRLGCDWAAAHKGLLTDVVRNEWGYTGYLLTDFCGMTVWPFSNFTKAILAGTDCLLSTESEDDFTKTLKKAESAPKSWDAALHRATKNICYMVANSSAMYTDAHSGKDREDNVMPGDMDMDAPGGEDSESSEEAAPEE